MLQRVRNVSSTPGICYSVRAKSTSSSRQLPKPLLSPEDVAINRSLKTLVHIASKGDRLGGFSYIKKRNAEKRRLTDTLATSSNQGRRYAPQSAVFYEGQDNTSSLEDLLESLQLVGSGIPPGSFVELRRDGVTQHGVVLDHVLQWGRTNLLLLMTTGEMLVQRSSDTMFVVPDFVKADLVDRCGTEPVSPTTHTTSARLSVLKRAKDFERAVENASSGVAQNIHLLYPKVASTDPEAWGEVSTIEAAHILGGPSEVPILRLFAVHKQLMQRNEEFVAHPTAHQQRHTFTVRPRAHLENMRLVKQWIRAEDKSPFPSFVKKAKKLIVHSRSTTTDEGPPHALRNAVNLRFSSAELQIIKFLQRSLRATRYIQPDPYLATLPSIVKAIDPIQDEIDHETIQNLLTEMGVISPWQDVITDYGGLHDTRSTYLPSSDLPHTEIAEGSSVTPANRHSLLACDPHHSIRQDFGNMPVYVIDDATAEELDDGVSFEPVPGEPESSRIYVHIADPTAVIPVDSELAQRARKQMTSLYYIHDSWPMLPSSLEVPDLSPKRLPEGEGRNVLTFSCKVDAKGNISEPAVRAGVVRNLIAITYDNVDRLLGFDPDRFYTRPFEQTTPHTTPADDISHFHQHASNLKQLHSISQRLVRNRLTGSTFTFSHPTVQISMSPRPPPFHPASANEPVFYSGFPNLRYSVSHPELAETGSRSLVAEFAKAACRVASRFCVQHGVPVIRKAAEPWQFPSENTLEEILAHRTENGCIDVLTITKAGYIAKPAKYTLEPEGHWLLGIKDGEGYARATSPLRRFPDMVAHWQIKAILKGERPPFSENNLLELIRDLSQFEAQHKKIIRTHERYWAFMFIRRFMQQNGLERLSPSQSNPVRNLDAYVMQVSAKNAPVNNYQTDVIIPSLGLVAELQTEKNMNFVPGDHVVVDIHNIRLGLNPRLTVELV